MILVGEVVIKPTLSDIV
ncbi:Protein of unknown function [Lactobacillus delbrueckii subsp. lactis]|nr:Protein of unknown function [Lactobacillus delbrueckii subsp. lactis]